MKTLASRSRLNDDAPGADARRRARVDALGATRAPPRLVLEAREVRKLVEVRLERDLDATVLGAALGGAVVGDGLRVRVCRSGDARVAWSPLQNVGDLTDASELYD